MKKIITITTLLMLLIGCSKKEDPVVQPKFRFTATTSLKPTKNTNFYDVFVSNDRHAPENLWIWAFRITQQQATNGNIFGFNFEGLVCNGILYADPNKPLFGCTRENIVGNITLGIDYNSINIKGNY